jgi:hypothetical protein
MTNFDKIKELTLEELARLIWMEDCGYCPVRCGKREKDNYVDCIDEYEQWLAKDYDGTMMEYIWPHE